MSGVTNAKEYTERASLHLSALSVPSAVNPAFRQLSYVILCYNGAEFAPVMPRSVEEC